MMHHNEILERLTGEQATGDSSRQALERLTRKYPWFGLPWYLSLKENASLQEEPGSATTGRALLHFSHPHLLHHYLVKSSDALQEGPSSANAEENGYEEESTFTEQTGDAIEVSGTMSATEASETHAADPQPQDEQIKEQEPRETHTPLSEKALEPINTGTEELVFEPLYTTDYFASQGIKLSEQPLATDKLGKQVKSFTEWLKSMKKINNQPDLPLNQPAEYDVQQLAEKSNAEAEVLTESMAEVLLSQGKQKKAREIYQKLSLQNPAKSAYFAAKSESLDDAD